jgi:hypothetical protein
MIPTTGRSSSFVSQAGVSSNGLREANYLQMDLGSEKSEDNRIWLYKTSVMYRSDGDVPDIQKAELLNASAPPPYTSFRE